MKYLVALLIVLNTLCSLPTVWAANITPEWLHTQVAERPIDSQVRYSIYFKLLNNNAQPIIINNKVLPSASLIKIPILVEAYRQKDAGLLNLKEKINIDKDTAVEGGSVYEMPEGSTLTAAQLMELMIVQSDNTATNILIDKLGMDNINNTIKNKLKLKDTILQRKMMDFDAVKLGKQNYTTVEDIGILLEKLYLGQALDKGCDQKMLATLLKQEDNTCIPAQLPANTSVAHKTGQLDGQYYDAAIVYAPLNDYILVIMADNVQNEPQAMYDMSEISRVIYDAVGRKPW